MNKKTIKNGKYFRIKTNTKKIICLNGCGNKGFNKTLKYYVPPLGKLWLGCCTCKICGDEFRFIQNPDQPIPDVINLYKAL